MKFGLGLLPNRPVKELVGDAVAADEAEFDTIWMSETCPGPHARNPFVLLTLIAQNTHNARFGTCIVSPYKWHPGVLAQTVVSLDEVSPGRMILGLGVGGRALRFLDRWWDRPIRTIREAIKILRGLFAGDTVTFNGKLFKIANAVLDPPSTLGKDQPIYIAA
ncbi:MAG: LLM class flavin-dependent oxidoreductase, partial [Candidatus Ranarchaeia archaeon]